MTDNLTPPLDDYSTQQARADERQRRKLRRALLAQWQALHSALDADGVNAVRAITDAEWQAAQQGDNNG
jgi:hypothetical protein